VVPWENALQSLRKVKVVHRHPDMNQVAGSAEFPGNCLDVFI